MANKESTAVNELIELMATQTPYRDPSEDLMFSAPSGKPGAPRMTATIPPAHSAGEVAPLPRTRAPQGTQQGVPAISMAAVRMSTAPASRSTTIPPLAPPSRPSTNPPPIPTRTATMSMPPMPPPMRTSTATAIPPAPEATRAPADFRQTKASLPPPMRQSAPRTSAGMYPVVAPHSPQTTVLGISPPLALGSIAPSDSLSPPSDALPPTPRSTTAPAMMPVAAPFEAGPHVELPPPIAYPSAEPYMHHVHQPDMTSHQPWFEQSEPIEIQHDIGTHQVAKRNGWAAIAGTLIVPMIGLVIVGVFIGGYFAFDGEGGHPPKASAEPAKAAANVAPANVVAKTEPAKAEPAKTEPAAEPAKTEPAAEPAKTEPAPVTPPNLVGTTAEPKPEPVKAEPKADPKPEPVKAIAKQEPAVVAPAITPTRGGYVDVRIDSKPDGATVMLVDRGKTMFLGTTPISTSLDPSRQYDLVFTYANKPTQLEHLNPATTKRIAVVLGKPGNQAIKAPAPVATEPTKKAEPVKAAVAPPAKPEVVTKKAEPVKTEVAPKPAKAEKPAPAPKAAKADAPVVDPFATKSDKPAGAGVASRPPAAGPSSGGEGTLMISSKPPCEIYVDGKATGLMTPQRAIKLAAGSHKITLVNAAEKLKKTLAVQITADQPTKVIQDLMK